MGNSAIQKVRTSNQFRTQFLFLFKITIYITKKVSLTYKIFSVFLSRFISIFSRKRLRFQIAYINQLRYQRDIAVIEYVSAKSCKIALSFTSSFVRNRSAMSRR